MGDAAHPEVAPEEAGQALAPEELTQQEIDSMFGGFFAGTDGGGRRIDRTGKCSKCSWQAWSKQNDKLAVLEALRSGRWQS